MFRYKTPILVAILATLLWLAIASTPSLHSQTTRLYQRAHESIPHPLRRYLSTTPPPDPQSQPPPRFTYSLSASYSAKQHRLNPSQNLYTHNPHRHSPPPTTKHTPQPRPQSGQDSFFIAPVGTTPSTAFAVADGVGGWQESGIDPADFAHGLCAHMSYFTRHFPRGFNSSRAAAPRSILHLGYDAVAHDAAIGGGGSTACVGRLDADGALEVANLGDSGVALLAPRRVAFASEPQTHAFNTPLQLSKVPAGLAAQMALFQDAARPFGDLPADADVIRRRLAHGDVLVAATDGVWDNLSPADALAVVQRVMEAAGAWEGGRVGRVAARAGDGAELSALVALAVVKEAKEASLDGKRDGPFAREVQKAYPGERWRGGKADDICVVVAVAVDEEMVKAKL